MITLKEVRVMLSEIREAEEAEKNSLAEVLKKAERRDNALLLFDDVEVKAKYSFKSVIDKKEFDRCKLQLKRLKERIERLESVINFMETNPAVDYLEQERARITNLIRDLSVRLPNPPKSGGEYDYNHPVYKKEKAEFRKLYGIDKMEENLKNINFILQKR